METVETINDTLEKLFGIDTITGKPIFRVVWSDDQFENRRTEYTDEGIKLLNPEVRYLPKYRQYIQARYILERLVLVPFANMNDLPTMKQSYEPLWVFQAGNGEALPPRIDACKLVIDTLLAATGKSPLAKAAELKNPEDPNAPIKSKEELYEHRKKEIDDLQNQLFGEESGLEGSTIKESGNAIIVPDNYSKSVH